MRTKSTLLPPLGGKKRKYQITVFACLSMGAREQMRTKSALLPPRPTNWGAEAAGRHPRRAESMGWGGKRGVSYLKIHIRLVTNELR